MRQKPGTRKSHSEKVVKDIRPVTRKQYSAEEKMRIVLGGLKGEYCIAELCRREAIAQSLYYSCSKEFLEAGKKRLTDDTARAATNLAATGLRVPIETFKWDRCLAGCSSTWLRKTEVKILWREA